jgi:hypothetical protein
LLAIKQLSSDLVALIHSSYQYPEIQQVSEVFKFLLVAVAVVISHLAQLVQVDQVVVVVAQTPPLEQATPVHIHLQKVLLVALVTVLLVELVVVALAVLEQTVEPMLEVTEALAHPHTTAQVSVAYFQSLA